MSEFLEKNRKYSDDIASTYDTTFAKQIKSLVEEIQSRREWIGVDWVEEDETSDEEDGFDAGVSTSEVGDQPSQKPSPKTVKVLDYACGTGLITRALAPHATQFIGIDISANMITQYNLRASNQGIPPSEIQGMQANLLDPLDPSPPALSGPEFFNFDLTVVGLGFHHFENPGLAAKRLGERLRTGGVLLVVDFLQHGHSHHSHSHSHSHEAKDSESHDIESKSTEIGENKGKGNADEKDGESQLKAKHTVMHMGFSRDEIEKMFGDAGLGNFGYVEVGNGLVFEAGDLKGQGRRVFMARATKL